MSESAPPPPYAGFLGTWILIPESCDYEQGDPPIEGSTTIEARDGRLVFELRWTDAEGRVDSVRFEGAPDGVPMPFDDDGLALAIEVVSARDLRTSAYLGGKELMVSQRQLDDTGAAMRVTQLVRYPDGSSLSNVSIYRRQID